MAPKPRLLSKAELEAARFARAEDRLCSRIVSPSSVRIMVSPEALPYNMSGLHIEPGQVVATNGHYLIIVPADPDMKGEDFPAVDGMKGEAPTAPLTLPAEACLDTLGSFPVSENYLRVSNYAALTATPEGCQLTTTNLESARVLPVKPMDTTFPPYEKVVPTGEPTLKTAFDAKYLKTICEYAIKYGGRNPAVKFDFTDANSPTKITLTLEDGREALIVLMPMKR